jgi:hypothetical protein
MLGALPWEVNFECRDWLWITREVDGSSLFCEFVVP